MCGNTIAAFGLRCKRREVTVERKPKQAGWTKPIVVFVLLVAAVGGYVGYKYASAYYRGRQAAKEVREVASKTYRLRSQNQPWFEIEAAIENSLRKRLPEILKIPSEDIYLTVRKDEKGIRITAEWTLIVDFGFFDVTDSLNFREEHWARTK